MPTPNQLISIISEYNKAAADAYYTEAKSKYLLELEKAATMAAQILQLILALPKVAGVKTGANG